MGPRQNPKSATVEPALDSLGQKARAIERRGTILLFRAPNVVKSVCAHAFLPLEFSPNFHPAPLPSWENGANVIWITPLPVLSGGAGGLSHGQICVHLYAQGSWAEGGSASALPFLLGDELRQDLVSSSRSTMTSGGASIPNRMRPLLACTTMTRMDSLMRMLSPTFRERTSMIDPSVVSLAATGPSMTLVGCKCRCRLPVGLYPCCSGNVVILPRREHWEVSG